MNYEEGIYQLVYSSRRVGEISMPLKCLSRRVPIASWVPISNTHAEELINIFDLAIQRGITPEDLKEIIFSHIPPGS
jgi:hypothetical protein